MTSDTDENGVPDEVPKRGCSWVKLGIGLFIGLSPLFEMAPSAYRQIQEKARVMQGNSNARSIILTLKNYAGDHNGRYPDEVEGVKTANDVFRVLFKGGLLADERAFTAASSPYEADNNIGEAPQFDEALKAGENHWSFVAGMTNASLGELPLLFENSANFDQWPPLWNCDKAGQRVEGRAWQSRKIIIGRNDGSVAAEQLEAVKGESVGLKESKKFFPANHDGLHILDVKRF